MSELTEKKVKTRIVHKHDIPEHWAQATNFVPKQGELIIYDDRTTKQDTENPAKLVTDVQGDFPTRYKIGDGVSNVNDLDFISKGMVDNNSLTCNANGIISLNQEYIDYLDAQVYAYPAINTFNIVGNNQEVGTTVTVTSFTHKETNVKNINGNLILTSNKNADIRQAVVPSESSTTVTFSDSYKFTTNTTLTYTLSGTDTRGNTISKTDSISAYYPSFIGASTATSLDAATITSSLSKVASSSLAGTRSVNASSHYVYFISTTAIKSIKSGGFDVSYSKQADVTLSINGISKSYYVYRTNELITSTLSYVIT